MQTENQQRELGKQRKGLRRKLTRQRRRLGRQRRLRRQKRKLGRQRKRLRRRTQVVQDQVSDCKNERPVKVLIRKLLQHLRKEHVQQSKRSLIRTYAEYVSHHSKKMP